MSSVSPLKDWNFLVGAWKGKAEGGQFGQKGIVEGTAIMSSEPSALFIMATGENRSEGQLLNRSISILLYDDAESKFKRKSSFPMDL